MLFLRILPLGLFSVLALALLVARVVFTQNSVFLVFAWNLFLAWVPLALALGLERASRLGSASLLGVAWLAFFPNAPYLVTDLVHLRHRAPVPLWYDVAFFATLALAGLFVGLASLEIVHRVLRRHVGARAAWGLVLLIFRPFKVGDHVKVAGVDGVVEAIDLFTCEFKSSDNRRLIVPNNAIFGATIDNVTHFPERRVDVSISSPYDADHRTT